VWAPLIGHLQRPDVVSFHLPGFGVPAPEGFGATKEEYVEWLVAELEAIGEPVDLVGHDWGGAFALRIACLRPDLLRSWSSDVAGLIHPEYVWHDFAQIWQTQGAGEEFFEATLAQPVQERIATLVAIGITPEVAPQLVAATDAEMARCVLALYRSAAQPAMVAWGADAEAAAVRPGLVLAPKEDPFAGGTTRAAEVAARMGAQFEELEGLGHWWMLHAPDAGARRYEAFWASVR
jgi:pimeloyl-ACP methyl ester carboxylesterase